MINDFWTLDVYMELVRFLVSMLLILVLSVFYSHIIVSLIAYVMCPPS